ncbi:MAG: Hsp20/alpha crystallin family protein [Bacteroidetes bacterium]|nr:MAG: Hsp20/alpha crystallin family protein [Bacteroidota bacterium]
MSNEKHTDDYLSSFKEGFSEVKQKLSKMVDDWFGEGDSQEGEIRVATDVYETREYFVIEIELPGASKRDVSMQIVDEELVVKGIKRRGKELEALEVYRQERQFGEFFRHFPLPDYIETENIKAQYEHGLLSVRFPKTNIDPEESTSVDIE